MPQSAPFTPLETKLLYSVGAIQFVNILDFMMVMPLGPDLSKALGIPVSQLGLIGGSYTAAAAVSGMIGALFLDRFERRRALYVALLGLVVGTAAGGFATGLWSLLAARVVAGAFGGPATSLALAVIADVVPPERRGRAMGAVMGAFSAASVLGVPAGLELARLGGFRLPFFAVAALGLMVTHWTAFTMPRLTGHLAASNRSGTPMLELLRRPVVALTLSGVAFGMIGNFSMVPNLATYWQFNLGYPRERLGLLYLVGGSISFFAMRIAGRWVDRAGSTRVAALGSLLYGSILFVGFIHPVLGLPVMLLFVCFMLTGSLRIVPLQALSTRVPAPSERASFMSAQSAVQHLSAAAGAVIAAQILGERPDGALTGMPAVATMAAGLAFLVPLVLWRVESEVRAREAHAAQPSPPNEARPEVIPSTPAVR